MKFITAAVVNSSKFVIHKREDGGYEAITGSNFELLKMICNALNLKLKLVTPSDMKWGNKLPNGSWTGMIGTLVRKEADIILNELTPTSERMDAVDFSFPYETDKEVFAVKKAGELPKTFAYLYPFQMKVWAFIVLAFLASFILLSFLLNFEKKKRGQNTSLFGKSFTTVSILLGHLGFKRMPSSFCSIMFLILGLLLMRVLIFSYTGLFLSFLMTPLMEKQIKNVHELRQAARSGLLHITSDRLTMQTLIESEEEISRDLSTYIRVHPERIVTRSEDVVPSIANGFAFIYARQSLLLLIYKNGETEDSIFVSEDCLKVCHFSAAFRKGYYLSKSLNMMVLKVIEAGIPQKLFNHELFHHSIHTTKLKDKKQRQITMSDLSGALWILLLGYTVSVIVILMELCVWKFGSSRNRKNSLSLQM